jgi:hypothetical protein
MAVNGYLTKKTAFNQALLDIGIQCGKQQIMDYMTIVLRDPNVVGSDIFGRERIDKVFAAIEALDKEFADAYTLKVEADYLQETLDRKLREVYGDELVPFRERQPHIKQLGYNKARKGWK